MLREWNGGWMTHASALEGGGTGVSVASWGEPCPLVGEWLQKGDASWHRTWHALILHGCST